ncbi:transketolase family protein [Candidatus Woesearchaeota archaeon]|nr:MAG: transketolase family protein [Candidatus Woesearchaeota archaeon]
MIARAQPKKALRDGFGEGILLAAKRNKNVVALSADLTESNRLSAFKKKFPERFIEVGVAEQNLIGLAAGMAHAGKIPFAASFAAFSPGRSWDQIRVSVCYSKANVKIYGGHAGLTVGEDGATHQALEDIAIMRVLPEMIVIAPADATEMKKAVLAAAKHKGPVYLRGGREKTESVTREKDPFTIGKANVLRKGSDITIVACGLMVKAALDAARILTKAGIEAEVINMHTIKPLDTKTLLSSAKKTGKVITAEEHQITGGLGSAVSETLSEALPVPLRRVGVEDAFGESGKATELLEHYGLTAKNIAHVAEELVNAHPPPPKQKTQHSRKKTRTKKRQTQNK